MIDLRPYQRTMMLDPVREKFRTYKNIALTGATGCGKTRVLAAISDGAQAKGNRVAILAHRIELIDQINDALTDLGIEADIVAAGFYRRPSSPVMLASVQTLIRRIDSMPVPDLVIIDECHHCGGQNTWGRILEKWSSAKRLGVTATPMRNDGKGLATYFDTLVLGPTVADLTPEYLSPARVFAPPTIDTSGLHTHAGDYVTKELDERANRPSITGDAIAHYRQHVDGKPALVFCVSIQHSTDVAQQFRDAGYSAVMLKGGMDRQLRKQAMADFRAGRIQIVTSCDIFSEGVDLPGAHAGIFLRPTQSLGLWKQQVGRILRKAPGKEFAWLLDHAGNTARFGLPTDDYPWALTYDEVKRKNKAAVSVRICPKCWAASSSRAVKCSNCAEPFRAESRREVESRDGELVEVTGRVDINKRIKNAHTLAELLEIERDMKYAAGWAAIRWAAKQRARERHMANWRAAAGVTAK